MTLGCSPLRRARVKTVVKPLLDPRRPESTAARAQTSPPATHVPGSPQLREPVTEVDAAGGGSNTEDQAQVDEHGGLQRPMLRTVPAGSQARSSMVGREVVSHGQPTLVGPLTKALASELGITHENRKTHSRRKGLKIMTQHIDT